MLKQFDFTLGDTEKDLVFIAQAQKKHKHNLEQVQQIIKTKKELEQKFTQQELQAHTQYVTQSQDMQTAKTVAIEFLKFLQLLKVPFESQNYEIHSSIMNILQVPGIKAHENQIIGALKFRLLKYQGQLDHKDSATIRRVQATKKYNLYALRNNEKQIQQIRSIIMRQAILSKCFQQLNTPYESNLMRIIFTKLYNQVRKSTILSPQYHQKQMQLIFLHIENLFKDNNELFENIFGKGKLGGYYYAIKQLYKYLVTNNMIEILNIYKSKLSIQKLYDLFQTMLKLQNNIKLMVNSSNDHIGDQQSILGVLYQKQHTLFHQFLEHQRLSIYKTKIFDNLDFHQATSTPLEQLQIANQGFKTILNAYYSKYLHSTCKFKSEVNKIYAELVTKMINHFKMWIINIIQATRSDNRQKKFNVLEQSKMVETQYQKNQIIEEIKKDHKEIENALNALKSQTQKIFQTLVSQEYEYLKKDVFSKQREIDNLYKEKENIPIQKAMFLKRMRMFFFKFIEKQDISRDKISDLLNIFEDYMKHWFGPKTEQIKNIMKAGSVGKQQKELMFLDKSQRQAIFKFKAKE